MKNLILSFVDLRQRLRREPLALFLDYDGTLAAIAPTPAEATLTQATQEILKALAGKENVKVAIISGRTLNDLQKIVPVHGLSFVGSHGVEFRVEGKASRKVSGAYLRELGGLRAKLKKELDFVSGVLFEAKPFSLAVHYRKVSPTDEDKVIQIVLALCTDAVQQGKISIMSGKKVIEIMPPNAMNKGQAVRRLLWLWGKGNYLPIFIGDDRTDESAFEALRTHGLTVRVGASDSRSRAEYYLRSVDDVQTFLRAVLYIRSA